MNGYTAFCAGLVFPMHEWAKGHATVALRRRLETSQWLPRAEIERQQAVRLRSFHRT